MDPVHLAIHLKAPYRFFISPLPALPAETMCLSPAGLTPPLPILQEVLSESTSLSPSSCNITTLMLNTKCSPEPLFNPSMNLFIRNTHVADCVCICSAVLPNVGRNKKPARQLKAYSSLYTPVLPNQLKIDNILKLMW